MVIVTVSSRRQLDQIRSLFLEYERFLEVDLSFQRFEEELAGLPGRYAPPDGDLLMAMVGGEVAGCVAMRKIGEGICEMKRLYVRPPFRGEGIGRRLAGAIVEKAKQAGYSRMLLDTLQALEPAMRLYESLGFRKCKPYYDNPLPGVVYWESGLT